MAFKANRSRMGMGEWMNQTSMDDPRYLFCWDCDKKVPHARKPFCHAELIGIPSNVTTTTHKEPTVITTQARDLRPATPAQLKYLKDIFAARTNNPDAMTLRDGLLAAYRCGALTLPMASDGIKLALSMRP